MDIIDIIYHPQSNGITLFISAFLFTLSLYHFLLFFQHRDRSYLYYSLYTIVIFLYTYNRTEHFFLNDLTTSINPVLRYYHVPLQWAFNTIYLLFVKTFISLKVERPKWNRVLNVSIVFYTVLLFIVIAVSHVLECKALMGKVYAYFFLPTITVIALITMYVLLRMDTVLKYYILIGSFIYLILSLTAFYLSFTGHVLVILFYIAVFFENIFFALGLGAKQRLVLVEKNKMQEAIINEHELNVELQEKVKSKLDKEVFEKTKEILSLTKKHEKEQRRKLAAEFSKRTLDLRMKALQTQMNPHFLFNALNSIKHYIIKNNKEDATYYLSKLSSLIRKILDNSQRQEISVKEEIEITKLYLDVENMRLDKSIILESIEDNTIDLNMIKIPPLILQPFIENAIWHGLALKKGEKKITIKIENLQKHLLICIGDNGIGREQAAINRAAKYIEKESLGIDLTKQRLEAFTEHLKEKVSITFEDLYQNNLASGTKVYIRIPLV